MRNVTLPDSSVVTRVHYSWKAINQPTEADMLLQDALIFKFAPGGKQIQSSS
jgi:hypothetical protein